MNNSRNLPHLVVIGAGFAGLEAAHALAHAPLRITMIDQHNHHLFQPLLYQVAIAGLLPSQVAYPVRTIFRRQRNLTFQMGTVSEIDFDSKFVRLEGSVIAYDYLILAAGGRTNFFGLESLERISFQLKDIESAVQTRNHLLEMFERASREADAQKRSAMLTFVIVGGGATGVETAGALMELITHVMVKDFRSLNLNDARVILLEASDSLIAAFPPELRAATLKLLQGKGVEIRLGAKMDAYDGERVMLADDTQIESNTLIWTAGVRAAALVDSLPLEKGSSGRIRVERTLQLLGRPEAFVVGDAAYLLNGGGRPLPMLSTVAMQEGKAAARNIQLLISGRPPQEFRYKDPGLLATIGRNAAVARIGGVSFSGFFAWIIWVGLHIFRLIGFRNRLLVMFNWAWDYVFYENQVRLITNE